MAELYNNTTSWESLTGLLVRQEIQLALNDHTSAIKDLIKDLKFEVQNDNLTVVWSYKLYDSDEWIEGNSFTITPTSTSILNINIPLNYAILTIKHGSDVLVNYTYLVLEDNQKIGNIRASIQVEITGSNNKKRTVNIGYAVQTSDTNNDREGSFVISNLYLYEGINTIRVIFIAEHKGLVVGESTININSLNLVLSTELTGGKNIDSLFSPNEEIKFNYSISGIPNISDSQSQIPIKIDIYYQGYKALTINYVLDGIIENITFSSLLALVYLTNISANVQTTGKLRLHFIARVDGNDEIKSNILMYDLISSDGNLSGTYFATKLDIISISNTDPSIYAVLYNHINIPIYCYTTEDVTLQYSVNNEDFAPRSVRANSSNNKLDDISFNDYIFKEVGSIPFSVQSNTSYFSIFVVVLSAGSSIIEPANVRVKLSSAGKTSDSREWKYNTVNTLFNNFDWSGNGWIKDASDRTRLLINNGATAIVLFDPCRSEEYTASFKFSSINNISGELLISCLSDGTGFTISSESATMWNSRLSLTTEFDSTSVHELTFVSYGSNYLNLMAIYIDGVILKVAQKSSNASHNNNVYITMTANQGELSIYNISLYSRALSFTEIQSIYALNLTDSNSIINYINNNNVFNTNTTNIGYYGDNVTIDKLPIGSTYMVITSYGELDPTPWKTINGYISDDPDAYKGVKHLVGSIKLVHKSADGNNKMNFYATPAVLSAQGTSSMSYPAKNFRIYFKGKISDTEPYYDGIEGKNGYTKNMWKNIPADFSPESSVQGTSSSKDYLLFNTEYGDSYNSAPANRFCLKADFAESSGSHNTGFARLSNFAFNQSSKLNTQDASALLPLLQILRDLGENAVYKYDIRANIDGRPIYLFFKLYNLDNDSDAIYYGKYNMNNDKSNVLVFGFEGATDYYNNQVVKNEASHLKALFGDINNDFEKTHNKYTIKNNEYSNDVENVNNPFINPNECWEFSNNTFSLINPPINNGKTYDNIGAFQYPYTPDNTYPLYNIFPNYDPFKILDSKGYSWLTQAWEYRYPDLDSGSEGDTYYRNGGTPFLLKSLYKWLYKHNVTLYNTVVQKNNIAADFASDLHLYFNVNYLLKYFVLTKWFGNVDQRIKNCMLSFYCDPNAQDNTNSETPMGHMRAFYIFYDNDTIMGVDNSGALTVDWNIEESRYPGYGFHAIWSTLLYCYDLYKSRTNTNNAVYNLGLLIELTYKVLREKINDDNLTSYFETDQCDFYPDAIFNVDAEIKYFKPSTRMTLLENASVAEPNRILNIHGNRKYHRKKWLSNRTRWFDSMFNAGNNSLYSYSFKYSVVASEEQQLGMGGTISITPAIEKWRFTATSNANLISDTGILSVLNNDVGTLNINGNTFSISDFVYINSLYGAKTIDFDNFKTDTGYFVDFQSSKISCPYLLKFIFSSYESDNIRLLSPENNSNGAGLNAIINSTLMPNLEEAYICHLKSSVLNNSSLGTLDLSKFYNLRIFDARDSDFDVILPNGSLLTRLYLNKPQSLQVENKPNLTLTIVDDSHLNKLVIGDNNNVELNKQLLQLADSKISVLSPSDFALEISFGMFLSYYISDDELTSLLSIAQKVKDGAGIVVDEGIEKNIIDVRGDIYNPNITPAQQNLLKVFGTKLVVGTSSSGEFEIIPDKLSVNEGESVTVFSNKLLSNALQWHWTFGNNLASVSDLEVSGLLSVNADETSITFNLLLDDNNIDKTYYLTVSAVYGNETKYTSRITVNYRAINRIQISVNNDDLLLLPGNSREIQIEYLPTNNTKLHLVSDNSTKIWTTSGGNGSISNNQFTMSAGTTEDVSVKMTDTAINLESNTIIFVVDKIIATLQNLTQTITPSDGTSSDRAKWIYNVLLAALTPQGVAALGSNIYISTLKNIKLNNYLNAMLSNNSNESYILDLNLMQYFTFEASTFNIQDNWNFSRLNIPEYGTITTVNWTSNPSDFTDYGTIVFNSKLQSSNISINSNTRLSSLKLDYSKCSLINTICNAGLNVSNGVASVSITYRADDFSNIGELFVYPPNLQQLGNISNSDSEHYPSTMFNIIEGEQGTPITINSAGGYPPIYQIGSFNKLIKVGAIFGYPTTHIDRMFSIDTNNITETFYTFYNFFVNPDGSSNGLSFNNINVIGAGTFNENNSLTSINVEINNNVLKVGYAAFSGFKGNITTTTSDLFNNITFLDFTNVSRVENYGFALLLNNINVKFDSAKLSSGGGIGENVFQITNGSNVSHNIFIDGSSNFSFSGNSFGTSKANNLYISSELASVLRNSASYSLLELNVNIIELNN